MTAFRFIRVQITMTTVIDGPFISNSIHPRSIWVDLNAFPVELPRPRLAFIYCASVPCICGHSFCPLPLSDVDFQRRLLLKKWYGQAIQPKPQGKK